MIGRTLSHYKLLELLGSGGMGIVYRARDERLERDVALKVLPTGALADDASRKQFRREALALSKLNHPNIETVHDFDTEDGVDFLVLELVPGETLWDRIGRGALAEREITRLGEQLAEGLAAAHRAGVLHRDIKPANVRVRPDGRLKILDFGLARPVRREGETTATETGSTGGVAGTIPYMPPEQLRGERLDERSDLYAAGAVLYEMATGLRAFPQESAGQVVQSVLNEAPVPPRELRASIAPELERIILKCLEKDREDRYQSARELAVDLRRLGQPAPARKIASAGHRAWRIKPDLAMAGILLGLAIVVLLNFGGLRGRLFPGPAADVGALAVLPLVNLSGDPSQDYFADGMTDELITRLAQVSALHVIARSSTMQYRGVKKSISQIAKELRVRRVLEGSVLRAADRVRITAHLVEAKSGRTEWADSYERKLTDVLALQSEVARAIVERIQVRLNPSERNRLALAPRVNPEAHEAYLKGLASFNQGTGEGYRSAVESFQRAIDLDPKYAGAYVGLANTYEYMSGGWLAADFAVPRARAAALKALELDPGLASAHAALAYVRSTYEWDWKGAEAGFRRALPLSRNDVTVYQGYGLLLTALGRFGEAEANFARARDLDPLSPLAASMSLYLLFEGRSYGRAITQARRLIEKQPDVPHYRLILGQSLLMSGHPEEAIFQLRKSIELDSTNLFTVCWLVYAYGAAGEREKALETWRKVEEFRKTSYIQPYDLAVVQLGIRNKDSALDWLEKAAEVRSDELILLNVDPTMDPIRSEPRFRAILKRMAFPS